MKEIKRFSAVILTVAFFIVFFFLCNIAAGKIRHNASDIISVNDDGSDIAASSVTGASFESSLKNYAAVNMENSVRIGAVGDLMVYSYQLDYAYNADTGAYDFSRSFSDISSYLRNTDLLTGNLETTIAGQQQSSIAITNGYMGDATSMLFNTPEAFLTALKSTGFTTVTNANNQILDYGLDGLKATNEALDRNSINHTGTVSNTGDARYIIQRVKGLNIGIIAYTNIGDDATFGSDVVDYVNYLNDYNEDQINAMCSHIKEMKLEGADFIMVSLHFGDIYSSGVNDGQASVSRRLCDAGADVILGSHPHVVEPVELYNATLADGNTKKCLIFYSLGNFLTSQQFNTATGYNRDLGCAVFMNIKKSSSDAYIESFEILPTYADWTEDNIRVVPLTSAKDNPELFAGQFDYLDNDRINIGADTVISTMLAGSGLEYTYENYVYSVNIGK